MIPVILLSGSPAAAAAEHCVSAVCTRLLLLKGFLDKFYLFPLLIYHLHRIRPEIPQTVLVQHIEIAWIHGSIRLYHVLHSAGPAHVAGFRHLAQQNRDIILKLPDIRLFSLLQITESQLEQIDQKRSVRLRCQRIIPATRFFHERIETGDKLQVI